MTFLRHRNTSLSTAPLFRWSMGYFLHRPSGSHALGDNAIRERNRLGKFRHAHAASLIFHNPIRAFISLLLRLCGPAAIILGIAEFVFYPVYGMKIGRAMAHILDEILKSAPSLANRDVPLGIPTCRKGSVTCRSCSHPAPAAIRPRGTASSSFSVTRFSYGYFAPGALSATGGFSGSQVVSERDTFVSAIAYAKPHGISSPSVYMASLKNNPFSESLSSNVFDVSVKDGTFYFSFDHIYGMVEVSAGQSASTGCRRALFIAPEAV